MKKVISLLLVSLIMLSALFCVPVSAASNNDGKFNYELSLNKKYYILTGPVSKSIKGSVKIPKEFKGKPVKKIEGMAFQSCEKITSVTVYSNIKTIGEYAFRYCYNLSDVTISDYTTQIDSTILESTAYYNDLKNWNGDVLYVGKHLIKADRSISGTYYVKSGTKTIGVGAFKDRDELKGIVLPDTISAIYGYTFSGCSKLNHIYIPEGVKSIGIMAFDRCNKLKYIDLPSTLKKLGESALPKMTAIYVPENVNDFDLWAIPEKTGVIYGKKGSPVEEFAENEGIPFKSISNHKHTTETVKHSTASVNTCGISYKKCEDCRQILEYNVTKQKKTSTVKSLSAENTKYGITLKWDAVKGADAYRVYRKAYGEDKYKLVEVSDTPYYNDQNNKNNKAYYYKVKSSNEAGSSDYSKTLKIRYVSRPEITEAINATAGVKITWKQVKYADKYRIYRMAESDGKEKCIKTITNYKTVSYVDETAKSGERYYYSVKAYIDSYDSGDVGPEATPIVRLSRPKLSSVTSTKSGVKFTWKKVTGADSYIVYRKTGSSGNWKELATVEGGSKVSYTDKTAKKGKTYYYSVRASKYGFFRSAYDKNGLKIKDKY